MKTIIEDLNQAIENAIRVHRYWKNFKDEYIEKLDWGAAKSHLYLEIRNHINNQTTPVPLIIWDITKVILTRYPEVEKIIIYIPTIDQSNSNNKTVLITNWLTYRISNAWYYRFYKKNLNLREELLSELFVAQCAKHCKRRSRQS